MASLVSKNRQPDNGDVGLLATLATSTVWT
jgi:hypothetical protein